MVVQPSLLTCTTCGESYNQQQPAQTQCFPRINRFHKSPEFWKRPLTRLWWRSMTANQRADLFREPSAHNDVGLVKRGVVKDHQKGHYRAGSRSDPTPVSIPILLSSAIARLIATALRTSTVLWITKQFLLSTPVTRRRWERGLVWGWALQATSVWHWLGNVVSYVRKTRSAGCRACGWV